MHGIRLVQEELQAALGRVGIQVFAPLGEPFDPNEHEAMAQQPSDEVEAGCVLHVYQQGYRLNGQVLRPAEVVASTREAHAAIAVELWRDWNARPGDSAWLRGEYGDPAGLAAALPALLAPEPLLPLPDGDARAARDAAWSRVHAAWRQHGEEALSRIEQATV